jgi:uncharacterized delta-60 repeat protein
MDWVIFKMLADGSGLDTSFNGTGKITFDSGNGDDSALAVKLQSNGKLLVAGTLESATNGKDFMIVRYNTDGSLDTGFGSAGVVTVDLSGGFLDAATDIDVQDDGKIVVMGYVETAALTYTIGAVRLNVDGTFDTSFDSDGKVLLTWFFYATFVSEFTPYPTTLGELPRPLAKFAIQRDGRIVFTAAKGSERTDPGLESFYVGRILSNGSADTSFDGDGLKIFDPNPGDLDVMFEIAIQSDDQIVLIGSVDQSTSYSQALIVRIWP